MARYRQYPTYTKPLLPLPPTLNGWGPYTNEVPADIERLQYTYPSFFIDPQLLTQPETITLDKWFVELSRPRWDVRREQWDYPYYFAPDTRLGGEIDAAGKAKFLPWYPDIVWDVPRTQWSYPFFTIDPKQLTLVEVTTPDKWIGEYPDIIWPKPYWWWLYPSWAAWEGYPREGATAAGKKKTTDWDVSAKGTTDWDVTTKNTSGWTLPTKKRTGWTDP